MERNTLFLSVVLLRVDCYYCFFPIIFIAVIFVLYVPIYKILNVSYLCKFILYILNTGIYYNCIVILIYLFMC